MNSSVLGGRLVAIKVLANLAENVEVVEEEYRIFKDLSRHDNFPNFYGAFLNKYDKEDKDELWLVMEVIKNFSFSTLLFVPEKVIRLFLLIVLCAVLRRRFCGRLALQHGPKESKTNRAAHRLHPP